MVCHCSELENRFGFQLTDPFSGHIDLTTDFGEGQWFVTAETETQAEDFLFTLIELGEPSTQVLLLDASIHSLHRLLPVWIGNEFAKRASVFFPSCMRIK